MAKASDMKRKLLAVFKDEQRFQLFIGWMFREFSSESILCFIEMIQYREHIQRSCTTTTCQPAANEYEFHGKMPKSSIVYGQKQKSVVGVNELKVMARCL